MYRVNIKTARDCFSSRHTEMRTERSSALYVTGTVLVTHAQHTADVQRGLLRDQPGA